ncbi:MAG: PEP/pyruvate-binding domain-containing protein [bacterium]
MRTRRSRTRPPPTTPPSPTPAPAPPARPGPGGLRVPAGADGDPDFLSRLGCLTDFTFLASEPLDAAIPGARSVKTVIDRVDADALYFTNTHRFPIHWEFASAHLSGRGLPVVPMLPGFNATEYSSPARRFLLGAVTYYEGPGVFVYEIAPYDTADGAMIQAAYTRIARDAWFGAELFFHPASEAQERIAATLPAAVRVITTDALYAGIDYQPLNVAESLGRLRFVRAASLGEEYLSFRDIAVLDEVPNDISVCLGIITEAFQTPLSHVNVLSRNRGTPNMGLRGAFNDPALRALEGQWVRLRVGPLDYTVEAVTQAEADAWWDAHRPEAVRIPGANRDERRLLDLGQAVDLQDPSLNDAIKAATRAFGGKAAHYGALLNVPELPVQPAFGVPVAYYFDFLEANGFGDRVRGLLADPAFQGDPAVRDAALATLRADMEAAPLDPAFQAALIDRCRTGFPGTRMRFRSSTNAEDLDGFTGAGLYTSKSGDPDDPVDTVEKAVRRVWASVWSFRAFEERSYRSIDHLGVGMALLVTPSFPDEEANGVAITANPFDPEGLEPAFYINVQVGEISVVQPPAGVTTETFLYFFDRADQPAVYISRSNQVPEGERVLNAAQTFALGQALDRIRTFFLPAYGQGRAWWAMDVEFKFDGAPGEEPALFIKQARPYQ